MRQSTAIRVIAAVVIIVIGALIVFALGRSRGRFGDHHGDGRHHSDMTRNGEEHPGESEGRHNRETDLALSGALVDGVRVIDIAARKFKFEPATVVVREGEKVRLGVTSEDVTHGIGIEDFDIDRRLEPGKTETIEFTAEEAGRHHFHCSIYCGSGHGDMHGELIVLKRH